MYDATWHLVCIVLETRRKKSGRTLKNEEKRKVNSMLLRNGSPRALQQCLRSNLNYSLEHFICVCVFSLISQHEIHFCHIRPTSSSSSSMDGTKSERKRRYNDIFIMWYIDMHTHKIDKQHCQPFETFASPVTIPLFISI